jgi:hypothetical protein
MIALLAFALSAHAQGTEAQDNTSTWTSHGELRSIGSLRPDVIVDDEGGSTDQGFVLDARWRWRLEGELRGLVLETEIDIDEQQVFGAPWALGDSPDSHQRHLVGFGQGDSMRARSIKVSRTFSFAKLEAGLMTSHWGLGMVANDGAHDSWFGREDRGDRVLRVKATTAPKEGTPLYLIFAADQVWEDDVASWLHDGQRAIQGLVAVLWRPDANTTVGLYGVSRHQLEADEVRDTAVRVIDLYADHSHDLPGLRLRIAGEAALIQGSTSRATSYQSRERLAVDQAGLSTLLTAHNADGVGGGIRAGWGSGDANAYDGTLSGFTMDRNHNAGMLLFDEVLSAQSVRAWQQLDDSSNAGQAPDGAEGLVTEGAIRQATWLQPMVEAPLHDLAHLRIGGVLAWSTAPIGDPFQTGRNGGVATTLLGSPSSDDRQLGVELDWRLALEIPGLPESSDAQLLLQGAHLLPGENIATDDTLHGYMATARWRW